MDVLDFDGVVPGELEPPHPPRPIAMDRDTPLPSLEPSQGNPSCREIRVSKAVPAEYRERGGGQRPKRVTTALGIRIPITDV